MVIMAVDFGYSRTGIAVCDKLEMLASPVTVIFEKEFDKTLEKTAEQAAKLKPGIIVVGLPKRTDGRPGETEEKAKEFAARLGELTGTEIVMWDE
ncbi:MAG: Holliday junction resolvase RuvX, partial [Oscillospiraceae bacterium]|nr:Holliday junction resolvase RuvX [Oscillospiraceae bacterium]